MAKVELQGILLALDAIAELLGVVIVIETVTLAKMESSFNRNLNRLMNGGFN